MRDKSYWQRMEQRGRYLESIHAEMKKQHPDDAIDIYFESFEPVVFPTGNHGYVGKVRLAGNGYRSTVKLFSAIGGDWRLV